MAEPTYKCGAPKEFSDKEKKSFLDLLIMQDKVVNPTIAKINRCKFLCACFSGTGMVSIGAIKPKTNSDFNPEKANLQNLRNDFDWELGYCFTLPEHTRKGYSSGIVNELLQKVKEIHLMASTELREDNSMKRILERNGFVRKGKAWTSVKHGGELGLFLKS